jgi:ribonucleoside-triphosphate reductase
MEKAFRATGTPVPGEYIKNKMLMNIYALMRTEDNIVEIESIQDAVEQVLSESGYFQVSKAYVLYRNQRKNVREAAASVLDYSKLVNGYLDRLDWRVKENSTVQYTLGGLILSVALTMALTVFFGLDSVKSKALFFDWRSLVVLAVVVLVPMVWKKVRKKEFSSIWLVVIAGVMGMLVFG